jgi:hypothetical protein
LLSAACFHFPAIKPSEMINDRSFNLEKSSVAMFVDS